MQNRYVGDIGDFGKYALLKRLCVGKDTSNTEDSIHLKLGVVWYQVPDEGHNEDGKHIQYLQPSSENNRRFKRGDPVLYDQLKSIVSSNQRLVSRIQESMVLPHGTLFYDIPLSYEGIPSNTPESRLRRVLHRNSWVSKAVEHITDCNLIFLDPDNGLEVPSVEKIHKTGPKYVYYDEIKPIVERGQSVVIYHHLCRNGKAEEQINFRLEQIKECLKVPNVFALLYKRGTLRVFFIIPAIGMERLLIERAHEMIAEVPWKEHFRMYGYVYQQSL